MTALPRLLSVLLLATTAGPAGIATPTGPGAGGPLSFTATDVTLSAAPRLLAALDADDDGALDLLVLSAGFSTAMEGHITVLENDGSGVFTPGWDSPHPENDDALAPMGLSTADLDGDGDLDAVITPSAFALAARLNNGAGELGTFEPGGGWWGGYFGSGAVGELNADGLPDAAHFTSDFGGWIDYGVGEGDGAFLAGGGWSGNPETGSTLLVLADADEDGTDEPIVSTPFGLYRAAENFISFVLVVPGAFRGHDAVDLDGDGHLDLVFTEPGEDRLGRVLGNGDGTFGEPAWFGTGREPDQLLVLDVDGDGHRDVVTGNVDQGSISILLGDGAGGFGPKQDVPTGPGPLGLAGGDFDGDGDTDLAVADAGATTVTILLQDGSPAAGAPR